MKIFVIPLLSIVAAAQAACDPWPNGTDTGFHWWQCNDGPITFFGAETYDETGANPEYPIHMGKPLTVKCDISNPTRVYGSPNLRLSISLWSNLDACQHGIKCPVGLGRQTMDVIVDFTKFRAIVRLLKDDAPYQMQYVLHDRMSGDTSCFMGQARARTQ